MIVSAQSKHSNWKTLRGIFNDKTSHVTSLTFNMLSFFYFNMSLIFICGNKTVKTLKMNKISHLSAFSFYFLFFISFQNIFANTKHYLDTQ